MPSIDKDFLQLLHDDYSKYPYFIETGTYLGHTTLALEPYFEKVYTIECSAKYFELAKSKYQGNKISFILGDSSKVFHRLLPTIHQKCVFFLDGHYSSQDTGRCDKDVPLLEEISLIQKLFRHEAILIIDDYRLFGTRLDEDWTLIKKEEIINILKSRIHSIYHLDSIHAKDDRLVIHINALS